MYTYMHACVSGCIYRHAVHRHTHTHARLRTHTHHTSTHMPHTHTQAHKHAHATHTHASTPHVHQTCTHTPHTHTHHTQTLTYLLTYCFGTCQLSVMKDNNSKSGGGGSAKGNISQKEKGEKQMVCVGEREWEGVLMHIHTYVHTYMCDECWVHLHAHYGTQTSRRSCFLQHHTRNALTVFLAYLKPQIYILSSPVAASALVTYVSVSLLLLSTAVL